jgi:hypothetical protein
MSTTEPTNAFELFRDEWTAMVFRHPALTDGEKLALLRLMTYCNRKTRKAWPSAGTLAEDCALSVRLVKRALSKGTEAGLIVTVEKRRGDDGKNLPTVRRFAIPEGGMVNERAPHGDRACTLTPELTPEDKPLNSTSATGRRYEGSNFQEEIEHDHPVPYETQGTEDIHAAEQRCRAYIAEITGREPTDDEYEDLVFRFSEWAEGTTRKNWPRGFCGYLKHYLGRDVPHRHKQLAPVGSIAASLAEGWGDLDQMFGSAFADSNPVPADTIAAEPVPAAVEIVDAEIVDTTVTGPNGSVPDEETAITPLTFKSLFPAEGRTGIARYLAALSALHKAGITDEEIHAAHKAGRMDQYRNPEECAEVVIRDRDTTTTDCPF